MISTRHPFRVDAGFLVRKRWGCTGFLARLRAASAVRGRRARRAAGNERAPRGRLISAKNRWILPKGIKDSVDLPDFVKESVAQIQILCTFQAGFEVWRVLKCGGF